jgi:hypothetical protein
MSECPTGQPATSAFTGSSIRSAPAPLLAHPPTIIDQPVDLRPGSQREALRADDWPRLHMVDEVPGHSEPRPIMFMWLKNSATLFCSLELT